MSVDFHSPATASVLTEDGAVGTSGRDTIVWGLVVGAGADAATATLYAGTSTGGTKQLVGKCVTANDSVSVDIGARGAYFSGGCYLDLTGTTPDITVVYSQSNE